MARPHSRKRFPWAFGLVFFLLGAVAGAQEKAVLPKVGWVVSQDERASRAGFETLKAGGRAIDAAIACAFSLAVVEPFNSGLGGGGFLLAWEARSKSYKFLDFREMAPAAATEKMYFENGKSQPQKSTRGWLAVAVPGFVAGMFEAHRALGGAPMETLIAPAITLARGGVRVDRVLKQKLEGRRVDLEKDEGARAVYLPGGRVPEKSQTLVQKDLAQSLELLQRDGDAVFYRGPLAQKIVQASQSGGGILAAQDLQTYRPTWRTPLRGSFRDYEIVGAPLPSSGGAVTIETLQILATLESRQPPRTSLERLHLIAEAMRLGFRDRALHMGDPRYVDVSVERFLSPTYALEQAGLIDRRKARGAEVLGSAGREKHTSHLVAADRFGNLVAMTVTLNTSFGAAVVAPGTGILMNNEMDDFSQPDAANHYGLVGNRANYIAPGKIPLSSMSPTLVARRGEAPFLALGSPGGPRIISSVLQVLAHRLDEDWDLPRAVRAPRIHHQEIPFRLYLEEGGFSAEVVKGLRALGHDVAIEPPWSNVQAVELGRAGTKAGSALGVSDPRGNGKAIGY